MKKTLLFVLFASMLPILSNAYNFESGGIYYNINEDGTSVSVTYNGNSYSGSVTIPSQVTYNSKTYNVISIATCAFADCSGLTLVTIPNSVTSIGGSAFSGCSGLTSVIIPNSVTSIGDRAFYWCSRLTSVTIPNSVTSIGEYAFYLCRSLTSVTIPNSVTSIGFDAFSDCSGLTSLKVEEGNPKYDSRNNCNAIIESATNTLIAGCKTTTIPNSVTSIGRSAFENCSNLSSVIIGTGVANIGDYVFSGCSGLTSLTIGNSVTNIGDYVFERCSSLTTVTIPNSVTHIGAGAFNHCSSMTSISIGSGIKSIKDEAFSYCSELTDVTCYAESVPGTNKNAFKGSYIEYTTLYVPSSAVDAYKKSEPWKYFKSIVEINPTSIETVIARKQEPVSYYSLDGRKIDSPKSGTVVVKKQGKRMKKVLIK